MKTGGLVVVVVVVVAVVVVMVVVVVCLCVCWGGVALLRCFAMQQANIVALSMNSSAICNMRSGTCNM